MKPFSREMQQKITPDEVIDYLKRGNDRFVHNMKYNRNLIAQVTETSSGQFPISIILSCIDSRVSPEIVFDLGIGYTFDVRIAGNHVNKDILGSMEFAAKLSGVKLVLVMGHTRCGAIGGACDGLEMGNLTHSLNRIRPAVDAVKEDFEPNLRNSHNSIFTDMVSKKNVELSIERIRNESPILKELEDSGQIKIAGSMYHIESGVVEFY